MVLTFAIFIYFGIDDDGGRTILAGQLSLKNWEPQKMCHQSWHTDWTSQIITVTTDCSTTTTFHWIEMFAGSFSVHQIYIQQQTRSYMSVNLQTGSDITALCRSLWQDWMRKDLFTSTMVDIHSERHPSMPNCSQC